MIPEVSIFNIQNEKYYRKIHNINSSIVS